MKSIPMRSVNQPAEQETRYQLNSPLLFGVLHSFATDSCIEVLDLAPANTCLLDYFSQYHCLLHLPGCRDELLAFHFNDEEEPPIASVLKRCLPMHNSKQGALDILLLWDLPNYLHIGVLSALISHLTRNFSERTVIHTYIHTRQTMPERPGVYTLAQDKHVTVEMQTAWTAKSPMYYQELLHKVFAPFRVDRGMLLANGLQEYILRAQGACFTA